MKWKTITKTTWVFIFQKYGKFWSVSLELFVKHKHWNCEECSCSYNFMWWTTIQLILLPICHLYLWNAHGALGAKSHNCGFNLPKYLQIWMNAIFLKEIVQFSKRMILISWLFLHNIFTTYLYFCCVFFETPHGKRESYFYL